MAELLLQVLELKPDQFHVFTAALDPSLVGYRILEFVHIRENGLLLIAILFQSLSSSYFVNRHKAPVLVFVVHMLVHDTSDFVVHTSLIVL